VLLARRGLGAEGVGIDPLLSATPLLLAVATVVIVLRVYPVPLRAIEGVLRRRPGLTGFLGAARAVRQPAGGVAAVLALVVGISVAVFSSVMATTLERGVEAAARASVGADLQASGTIFGPSQLEQVRALPDIESMASLQDAARRSFTVDQVRGTVTLIIADVAELREVRPDFPLPADLTGEPDGAVPMLVSDDLAAELEPDAKLLLGSAPAEVVAVADRGDGVVAQSRWVLIDAAHAEDGTNSGFLPRILLIDLAADADTAAVAEAVAEIGGSTTTIREPAQAARDIRAAPAVSGLQTALVLAMALVALLAAIAVVMASVVGASARGRMLALLSTLGLSRREAGGLAAWELAPVAITATVVGTALGLALPWLVVAGLDLRPFTGGSVQPAIAVDVFAVLGLVGVFAAVVAAAVLAGLVIGQRTDAAAALRMGEEG
jgi:putative ABC transport system permease protein